VFSTDCRTRPFPDRRERYEEQGEAAPFDRFTDNGRDWLGNDRPPDELNHAPRAGMNFGYPYCQGKGIADPEFGTGQSCGESAPIGYRITWCA
jgi:hypothetical protein